MYNVFWGIIGFCIFFIVTLAAISTENPNLGKRINFVNVNFAVRNTNNEIVSKTVPIGSSDISKTTLVEQTTVPNQYNVTSQNEYKTYTTENKRSSDTVLKGYKKTNNVKRDRVVQDTSRTSYERQEYDSYAPKYKTTKEGQSRDNIEYGYDNIDWATWKSNFVNKILDDSVEIKELDNYPNGAFFYYSFVVDNQGGISMVKVRSMYLSEQDKRLVADFIRSYAHTAITRFPAKSNRKTASVSAIMMLSNAETVHSKPSDFNDTEKVKYQIKR